MSNTLKATKLDFSLVKPYIKVIGFTMLLPIAFAAINRSILTGVSFAMCFIAMTTGYTFSVTEKNSMERLYGILPIKKSEMVTGRYLFVLALGAMALVVSLITQPIVLRAMGESVGAFDMISAAIGGLFLFALYTVFQIPGYYKYGAIKGRVFMYIPVAGFLATLFFLPKMPADNPIVTTVVSSPVLLIGLVLVLVVVMYAVSIWFSIRIMENKEMKSITIESKCDSNDAEGSDLLVFNLLYEFFKNYTPRDNIFTKAKLELEYFDDEPTSFITTMNPEDFKRGDIKIDEKDTSYKKLFEVLNNHEFSINECNKVKFSMWLYLLYLQLYGEGINLDNDTINVINKYLTTFSIYSLNRSDVETLFHTNVRLLCEKFNNIFISTGIPFALYSEDKKNIKFIIIKM